MHGLCLLRDGARPRCELSTAGAGMRHGRSGARAVFARSGMHACGRGTCILGAPGVWDQKRVTHPALRSHGRGSRSVRSAPNMHAGPPEEAARYREDGMLRTWLDGELVGEETQMLWRLYSNVTISFMHISTFFGGSDDTWGSPQDQVRNTIRGWPPEVIFWGGGG